MNFQSYSLTVSHMNVYIYKNNMYTLKPTAIKNAEFAARKKIHNAKNGETKWE